LKVVLAIDALEYSLVEEFNCLNLMQKFYGKTDISEFSEPRTMVLWSSFMTGRNMEEKILSKGDKEMWSTKIDLSETFFKKFKSPRIIDLPGFNYEKSQHDEERRLLKQFFEVETPDEKNEIKKEYNKHAFEHHRKIKKEFETALGEDYDFLLCYFSLADVIGHLNFGNRVMMKMIYGDLNEIAGNLDTPYLVISDHGMTALGVYGDHSNYGFWSTELRDLGTPRISDFSRFLTQSTGA
jgi:hypothetical protein